MRSLTLLIALLLTPFAAIAQEWRATLSSDNAYVGGWVGIPSYALGFSCAARAPAQGSVINSTWFETSIAPPWHYLIGISENLIPYEQGTRNDLILFVDQTGYRLPPTAHNEMEGGWQFELPMTDGLFAQLPKASRLVLQVGTQAAWELPVANLGPALDTLRNTCAQTWIATGFAAPAGLDPITGPVAPAPAANTPFHLPPQVQAFADARCNGPARIGPQALQAGDLDFDGRPDVLMDWNDVLCPGETRSGYCGAANCSIDFFMSTRGYAHTYDVLAVGAQILPHLSGALGVRMGGTARVCAEIDCSAVNLWNGQNFRSLED